MQETHSSQDTRVPIHANGNGTVYDFGVKELHHVATDDGLNRRIDGEFKEARGRETTRLHVTLKSISEADRRGSENTRATLQAIERLTGELQEKSAQLQHLVESFEQTAQGRFNGVHDDLRQRVEALSAQINEQVAGLQQSVRSQAESNFNEVRTQAATHFNDLRTLAQANHEAISTQTRETRESITYDIRQTRDELVSLVDSRMNQADSSFAAVRGDVEVLKFLVMDLIKDRIGRHDPKNKPF